MDVVTQFSREIRNCGSDWKLYASCCRRYGGTLSPANPLLLDVAVTAQQGSCTSEILLPEVQIAERLQQAGYIVDPTSTIATRFLRGAREVDAEFQWLQHLDLHSVAALRKLRKQRVTITQNTASSWTDALVHVCAPRAGWGFRFLGAARRSPIHGDGVPSGWEAQVSCGVLVDEDSAWFDLTVQACPQDAQGTPRRGDATRIRRLLRERLVDFTYKVVRVPTSTGTACSLMLFAQTANSLLEAREGRKLLDRLIPVA